MSSVPSVSLVIAVRDGARYLAEALASVAAQSVPPAEVIVVDDGSVDDSGAVAAAAYRDARILRQAPSGYAAAVNRGVRNAGGDVLAFLDADDVWTLDAMACRLTRLEEADAPDAVVGTTRNFASPDLTEAEAARIRIHERAFRAELLAAMVVRADVFGKVGLLDESFRTGAAIDWVSRARREGVRFAYLDDVVLQRRLHRSNLGRSAQDERNAELLRIVAAHRSRHQPG
jgi:glycosyltransferase involved in cell wall biosynthesis